MLLVAVRACAHVLTRDATAGSPSTITLVSASAAAPGDATDTTPSTLTPVGASAAAPARTMRFSIHGTVSVGGSRLPTHRLEATSLLQLPGTPVLQRHVLHTPAVFVHVCVQHSYALALVTFMACLVGTSCIAQCS